MSPRRRRDAANAPSHFSRHRLFWRLYLNSVLMIAVVGLFLAGVAYAVRDHSPWERLPRAVASQLEQVPDALRGTALVEIAKVTNLDLVLYGRDGRLLAEAREPNACQLSELDVADAVGDLSADRTVRVGRGYRAFPVGADAFLVARWRGHDPRKLIYVISGLLVLLALISWPRARRISQPLETIMGTIDRVSGGAFDARIGPLRAPTDVRRLGGALDEMLDALARLRAHEKALLADISHELRTPMARIRVGLEWAAEEGTLPEPLQGLGDDLAELETLVDDVLISARLDPQQGAPVVNAAPADLADFVAAAAARFAQRHPGRTLAVPGGLDALLCVDGRLAHRVLDNLLDNAGRYTDGPVAVAVTLDPHRATFEVRDHGPGVEPHELPHLFDAFWRAERSRSKASGGVGLGLTLCQRIVSAHGGEITARLAPEGGLIVRFTLPLVPPEGAA